MKHGKKERNVAYRSTDYAPNNSQPTNFIMNEFTVPHADEMQFPRAHEFYSSGKEKAFEGIRKPH